MRRTHYFFRELSKAEREFCEAVLYEELENQTWYVVSCSVQLAGEVIIPVQ